MFLFVILYLTSVFAQYSIPSRKQGFASGPADAALQLEAYVDLLCPDSAGAWPKMKELKQHYGDDLNLIVQIMELPYHRNTHEMAIATQVLASEYKDVEMFDWFTAMFKGQETWYNSNSANCTQTDVQMEISTFVVEQMKLKTTAIAFYSQQTDRTYDLMARTMWKHCTFRTVSGTPSFFVNDVVMTSDPNVQWTTDDWIKFLDGILGRKP